MPKATPLIPKFSLQLNKFAFVALFLQALMPVGVSYAAEPHLKFCSSYRAEADHMITKYFRVRGHSRDELLHIVSELKDEELKEKLAWLQRLPRVPRWLFPLETNLYDRYLNPLVFAMRKHLVRRYGESRLRGLSPPKMSETVMNALTKGNMVSLGREAVLPRGDLSKEELLWLDLFLSYSKEDIAQLIEVVPYPDQRPSLLRRLSKWPTKAQFFDQIERGSWASGVLMSSRQVADVIKVVLTEDPERLFEDFFVGSRKLSRAQLTYLQMHFFKRWSHTKKLKLLRLGKKDPDHHMSDILRFLNGIQEVEVAEVPVVLIYRAFANRSLDARIFAGKRELKEVADFLVSSPFVDDQSALSSLDTRILALKNQLQDLEGSPPSELSEKRLRGQRLRGLRAALRNTQLLKGYLASRRGPVSEEEILAGDQATEEVLGPVSFMETLRNLGLTLRFRQSVRHSIKSLAKWGILSSMLAASVYLTTPKIDFTPEIPTVPEYAPSPATQTTSKEEECLKRLIDLHERGGRMGLEEFYAEQKKILQDYSQEVQDSAIDKLSF